MKRKQTIIEIAILAVLCGTFLFWQYLTQEQKQERLAKAGQETPIIVKPFSNLASNHVNYYFITANGQRIEGGVKCGNDFYKYLKATAIYNPSNPEEYELSIDRGTVKPLWATVLFFLICWAVMTYVTYGFLRFGKLIYRKLKN